MVNLIQDRNFVAKNYLRKGKDARYAIKEMSPDILRDPERFVAGMIDLAIEAKFLAVLRHPNIIKMRATASSTPYNSSYFVLLIAFMTPCPNALSPGRRKKARLRVSVKFVMLVGVRRRKSGNRGCW